MNKKNKQSEGMSRRGQLVSGDSLLYTVCRPIVHFLVKRVYYKEFVVEGRENIPVNAPIILVSNHQNGLLDALGILGSFSYKKTPVFLARADIFKKEKIARILYFLRILPIYRQRDGMENLEVNQVIFGDVAKIVEKGCPICLFPEGQHQDGHYLGHLKKGFARIAFLTAEQNGFPENIWIQPMVNHYERYHGFRTRVLLKFLKPVPLFNYYQEYKMNPIRAVHLLQVEVEEILRKAMLDLQPVRLYPELNALRILFRTALYRDSQLELKWENLTQSLETPLKKSSFKESLKIDKLFAEKISQMETDEVEKLCGIYREKVKEAALGKNWMVEEVDYRKRPMGERILKGLKMALLSIPAVIGYLLFAFPIYKAQQWAKKQALAIRTFMLRGSFEFVLAELILGVLLFVVYGILFAVLGIGIGDWHWTTIFTYPILYFLFKYSYLEVRTDIRLRRNTRRFMKQVR